MYYLCDTPLVQAESMAQLPAFYQVRVNCADPIWADMSKRHRMLHAAVFGALEVVEVRGVDLETDEHRSITRGIHEMISMWQDTYETFAKPFWCCDVWYAFRLIT